MRLLTRIVSFFDDWQLSPCGSAIDDPAINPATGLPMTGEIDVAGNPFGTNLSSHRHDHWQHDLQCSRSSFDDHRTGWHDTVFGGMGRAPSLSATPLADSGPGNHG
jgi:hypothetical protein